MQPTALVTALGIAQLIWLAIAWKRSGFLSALNLFLFGTLVAVQAIASFR